MNWWAKRAAWCSVVILLFSACNKDSEIGTGINPTNPIGTSYTDSISVVTSTILINDSITSSKQGYLIAGAYHDPYTGNISAEAYAELKLKEENRNIDGFIYDSARLYLDYTGYYYGDTLESQTLEIYELTDGISHSTTYFTQSVAHAKGAMIGSKNFSATPNTSPGNQLVINIDDAWAEDVLSFTNKATNAEFFSDVKGIAIVPQNNNQGAILRFRSNQTSCKMVFYFRIGADNKQVTLYINGDGYYRIDGDRSGTDPDFAAITPYGSVNSSLTGDVTYIQAGVGLKTKFTLPYLQKFQEQAGVVAINKVNLILPFAESSTDDFSPLTALFFIQTDATNKVKRDASGNVLTIQKNNTVPTGVSYPLFVTYNKNKNRYEADITDYFQALLTGKLDNEGFYITPSYNSLLLNRTVLNSQSTSLTNPLKLELYYTLIE